MGSKKHPPMLQKLEFTRELAGRTDLSQGKIDEVFQNAADIILECVISGVNVTIPYLGHTWFKDIPPLKDIDVFVPQRGIKEHKDEMDGYRRLTIKPNGGLKKMIKEQTTITCDEFYGEDEE